MIEFYYWEYALERFSTWLMGICLGVVIGYIVTKQEEKGK